MQRAHYVGELSRAAIALIRTSLLRAALRARWFRPLAETNVLCVCSTRPTDRLTERTDAIEKPFAAKLERCGAMRCARPNESATMARAPGRSKLLRASSHECFGSLDRRSGSVLRDPLGMSYDVCASSQF